MAVKPTDNETFYREVDEEVRRDRMASFWRRYALWVIAGVALVLALIAGILVWQHRQTVAAGEQAETLTKVFDDLQAERTKDVPARLDAIEKDGNDGYALVARLTKADAAIERGDTAAAVSTYAAIAADDDVPPPYRALATVRQTTLEFDKLPPATVIARLKPYAAPGNPWFGTAGELTALAYLQQNQPALAGPIFAQLAKDETLPPSVRSRAVQMAGSLGLDATGESKTEE